MTNGMLLALLIAGGFGVGALLGLAPNAHAASQGSSASRHTDAGRPFVLERKARPPRRRARAPRILQPMGPAYVYYDYPYYYSRGHYPTHIARYVYVPNYSRRYSRTHSRSCFEWRRNCLSKRPGACRCR
jgi:hypothetical protein